MQAMREILFRGKRTDNGEWKTGSLVIIHQYMTNVQALISDKMTGYYTPVDPATVGQYTGLKDKNGTKIFEGDILGSRYDEDDPNSIAIEIVMWHKSGWCIKQGNYIPDPLDEDDILPRSEVIGNIHDNPERLAQEHLCAENGGGEQC